MIRLALVGLGKWGINYLKTAKLIPSCKITHICSQTPQTLQKFPSDYKKTTRYQDLAIKSHTDGVIIATPGATHFTVVRDFISMGIPVLVEKPLTSRYSDAVKLKELVENQNSVVMVGHIYLYNPAFIKMKSLISNIGSVTYISTEGVDYGPFRKGISPLWDWGPHDISMCLSLLKQKPVKVTAWTMDGRNKKSTLFDMVRIRITFASGLSAFCEVGSLSPTKRRLVYVMGSKGSIIFNDMEKNKITFYRQLPVDLPFYPKYPLTSPLQAELEEFISCIRQHRQPESNIVLGVQVVAIIEAAHKSILSNTEIELQI